RAVGSAGVLIGHGGEAELPPIPAGGLSSSAYPKGALSPRLDTLKGTSAPHIPGPRMGSRRTMPAPSLTVPALRHASSASCRHASRSAKKPPPVQPASTASTPTSAELPQYQRLPHAMAAECDAGC